MIEESTAKCAESALCAAHVRAEQQIVQLEKLLQLPEASSHDGPKPDGISSALAATATAETSELTGDSASPEQIQAAELARRVSRVVAALTAVAHTGSGTTQAAPPENPSPVGVEASPLNPPRRWRSCRSSGHRLTVRSCARRERDSGHGFRDAVSKSWSGIVRGAARRPAFAVAVGEAGFGGPVASGIAHEINTPIQYIGDNFRALSDTFEDFTTLVSHYRSLVSRIKKRGSTDELVTEIEAAENECDLDFLLQDTPQGHRSRFRGRAASGSYRAGHEGLLAGGPRRGQ